MYLVNINYSGMCAGMRDVVCMSFTALSNNEGHHDNNCHSEGAGFTRFPLCRL